MALKIGLFRRSFEWSLQTPWRTDNWRLSRMLISSLAQVIFIITISPLPLFGRLQPKCHAHWSVPEQIEYIMTHPNDWRLIFALTTLSASWPSYPFRCLGLHLPIRATLLPILGFSWYHFACQCASLCLLNVAFALVNCRKSNRQGWSGLSACPPSMLDFWFPNPPINRVEGGNSYFPARYHTWCDLMWCDGVV